MIFKKVYLLRARLKSNADISVDFLLADDACKREALKRRTAVQIADFSVNIPTPEDLILLRKLSGRPQDNLDAEKIFAVRKNDLDMNYIQKWAAQLDLKLLERVF
jgi:hypothetical protein